MSVNPFLEAKDKHQGPHHKASTLGLLYASVFQLKLDRRQGQSLVGIFITFFRNVKTCNDSMSANCGDRIIYFHFTLFPYTRNDLIIKDSHTKKLRLF